MAGQAHADKALMGWLQRVLQSREKDLTTIEAEAAVLNSINKVCQRLENFKPQAEVQVEISAVEKALAEVVTSMATFALTNPRRETQLSLQSQLKENLATAGVAAMVRCLAAAVTSVDQT